MAKSELKSTRRATPFVIIRVLDAPRELVFKMWTDQSHLTQWWGPKGFEVKNLNIDLRPGGTCHYCMVGPNNAEMWGMFFYKEVSPPERLVWINCFSDPDGNIVNPPFDDPWPRELLTTVTFTAQGEKTEMRVEQLPINAGEAEIKTFEAGRDSMTGGWTGTLAKLEAYILKL